MEAELPGTEYEIEVPAGAPKVAVRTVSAGETWSFAASGGGPMGSSPADPTATGTSSSTPLRSSPARPASRGSV